MSIIDRAFFLTIAACLIGALVVTFAPRVEAAPDVPICEAINMAGSITVYRCEPDEGATYLINSLGFMLVED